MRAAVGAAARNLTAAAGGWKLLMLDARRSQRARCRASTGAIPLLRVSPRTACTAAETCYPNGLAAPGTVQSQGNTDAPLSKLRRWAAHQTLV